jgi:hypothetical protein
MSLGVVSVTRPPEFEVVLFAVVVLAEVLFAVELLELTIAVDELGALAAITPVR